MGKILGHVFGRMLGHIEEIVLVPGFALMLIINFGNVVSRYILHSSWAFTEELCVMLFVYITFFGAAVAVKQRQHLGFTLVLDKLSPIPRMVFETFITVFTVIFIILMIKYGILVCQNQMKFNSMTAALRIPTAYGGACIPIGGVFILMRTVQVYIENIRCHLKAYREKKGN